MFLNRITVTTLFCVSAASMVAAEPKSLILQTEPEPTVIELIGSVEILPSSGDILAVPADPEACTGTDEAVEVSCDDVQVETSSLSVNSNSVEQGQNVRFTWDSRGAWSCAATGFGNWENETREPSGNATISTDNIAIGTHNAALTCFNGPVNGQTRSVSITVEEPDEDTDPSPTPAACEDRGMPNTWSRMTTGSNSCHYANHQIVTSSDCRFIEDVWGGAFDELGSTSRVLGMAAGNGGRRYIAMEFNSGNTPADEERLLSINVPQVHNMLSRRKFVSISQCPGDFDVNALRNDMGPGCIIETFTNNFRVGGSDFRDATNRCGLEPNTTYYLNVLHTESPLGASGDDIEPHRECDGSSCGSRYTWY